MAALMEVLRDDKANQRVYLIGFDVEGSGYGFRVVKTVAATATEMPTTCELQRS
jgi:hypothetical protein